ncbi:hypothetical protein HW555_009891 [Spodoptera exigua]|uniref:Uncharacterized protein n=1 Tax=Spodoptera exigua TaxID=7107 RepID=A0A835GAE8_SPOEX|nr:hypothetical protein HW555_009891 [Spodoptera exigua]
MGLLISKIWSLFGNEVCLHLFAEHKLVLVGLDNAGKTTILYQLLLGEAVHTRPTIGSNVEEVVWRNLRFVMWDLGGQQSLRSAWTTYYTNSEFVIMVIDSTDRNRLSISRDELHQMLKHEELSRACLLVYANKQDVKGSMTAAEISEQLDLTSIKQHPWHIQACCALTGEGLHLGLEWIASRIKKK